MALTGSGIDKVKAFALPAGIRADGQVSAEPQAVLVTWCSDWDDRLHQIYVDGKYAGTTIDIEQCKMIVHVPSSLQCAVRIEVYAVELGQAHLDLSSELETAGTNSGKVRIGWLRLQELPFGATVQIFGDSGTGSINYEAPLTNEPVRIWPAWQDKSGLGLSRFGNSDFGFDGSAVVGFGRGVQGIGEFGFDADLMSWTSCQLQAGCYKFGIKIADVVGNKDEGQSETQALVVIPAAKSAEQASVVSFNKQTNELVLNVS